MTCRAAMQLCSCCAGTSCRLHKRSIAPPVRLHRTAFKPVAVSVRQAPRVQHMHTLREPPPVAVPAASNSCLNTTYVTTGIWWQESYIKIYETTGNCCARTFIQHPHRFGRNCCICSCRACHTRCKHCRFAERVPGDSGISCQVRSHSISMFH